MADENAGININIFLFCFKYCQAGWDSAGGCSAAFSAVVSESLLQKSYLAGKDICKTGETGASMLKTPGNLQTLQISPRMAELIPSMALAAPGCWYHSCDVSMQVAVPTWQEMHLQMH